MSDGLSAVSVTENNVSVFTGWGDTSELVQSKNLTTSLQDSGTGGTGDSQSSNGELWKSDEGWVVSDSADNDNDLASWDGTVLKSLGNVSSGDWWSVDLGKVEVSQDGLVELRFSATGQNSVKRDKKTQLSVLGFWGLTSAVSSVLLLGVIDTHGEFSFVLKIKCRRSRGAVAAESG